MKKWTGIALLLVLVMSVLAACGGNNESNGENAGSGTDDEKSTQSRNVCGLPSFRIR